ncbi:nicotinate-nucleotide adenylyltransferase [Pelagerythrobacter marinus]|uniref:Probable nicotinate-nucleotide adenylyltransferase n=1 Tax=Pelagerythrobacter marinus TaxID=538382 RepID=A0ABW9UWK9_9SPHN|nr:nicotinate-nucleotide adenylyltransferase [Pelagerythrobacter marinus]MXO68838.1 nicotinate-nucleotide adenylyltransferase [Pelagerythrobacter marinus]USA41143.1 nicotinate-nucleotide adenylyltransferase [Pelagerythrobacter marinus]WPZ08533.1 nicotinate-nucleotide adenylyltransferase [Pelagerythrobacter marinus]
MTFARRIGLLGGSFNPAHGGHRRISLFAREALGLDEIWWLVSPGNPLKPRAGMAPLAARVKSALRQARGAPIRVTAIERELGTRYTADTLRALAARYPRHRFAWLMGSDNLAQFHQWRDWRDIARALPIAVIARPGYDGAAFASPAMAWLRRHRVDAAAFRNGGEWSAPSLVILRFDPDPRSATAIRRDDPDWADRYSQVPPRDQLTFRPIRPISGGNMSSRTASHPAHREHVQAP